MKICKGSLANAQTIKNRLVLCLFAPIISGNMQGKSCECTDNQKSIGFVSPCPDHFWKYARGVLRMHRQSINQIYLCLVVLCKMNTKSINRIYLCVQQSNSDLFVKTYSSVSELKTLTFCHFLQLTWLTSNIRKLFLIMQASINVSPTHITTRFMITNCPFAMLPFQNHTNTTSTIECEDIDRKIATQK